MAVETKIHNAIPIQTVCFRFPDVRVYGWPAWQQSILDLNAGLPASTSFHKCLLLFLPLNTTVIILSGKRLSLSVCPFVRLSKLTSYYQYHCILSILSILYLTCLSLFSVYHSESLASLCHFIISSFPTLLSRLQNNHFLATWSAHPQLMLLWWNY